MTAPETAAPPEQPEPAAEPPSDAALLEYAFRSRWNQRELLSAPFGKRTLTEIRRAIITEAKYGQHWIDWVERHVTDPVVRLPDPVRSERMPPDPIPETPRAFWAPEVPRRFAGATFDAFDVNYSGQEFRDQLAAAHSAAQAWVKLALAGKPACVALVGSQGNGKSMLLWSAVKALTDARVHCYARSWYRLADELRYGGATPWLPGAVKEAYELRQLLLNSAAVAIDEVCATAGTSFDESELGKIVKNAWDNRQALIVTTNVHPLSNLMGAAAADRFTIVQLTAPSGRNRT